MRRLVALDLGPSQLFVDKMRACFDDGDAVFPLDQRLSAPARQSLLAQMAPALVISGDGDEHHLGGAIPVEDGDAFVLATSGTTRQPRGVVLTHDAIRASAIATSSALGVDAASDRWLCCLPVAHVGGLSVITRALERATPLTVFDTFAPNLVRDAVRNGVTLISLVPTALFRLDETTIKALRKILLGGSRIPKERPANAVATYGMTETASGVVYDGAPIDGVEMRINDGGEIALRAPMLLRAYRDGTDPKDKDGWFATGDAGRLRSDGRLVVDGRLDELIISGGEKIWPGAIEAVLSVSPKVREVAVAGVEDPEWGERVVAYVVPADENEPPTLEELRELVKESLAGFAAPRQVVLVESLPKGALGKVRRHELGAVARLVQA